MGTPSSEWSSRNFAALPGARNARALSKVRVLVAGEAWNRPGIVTRVPDISDVSTDLRAALKDNKRAERAFEGFDNAHRDEIVQWVEGAHEPQHRAQRVALAVKLILESPG